MQQNICKLFKDPIYGYIQIPEKMVRQFIDSACFQRLRRIGQTSYTPLYPAALHNRFIHSIGVYHLGKIAFESLKKDVCKRYQNCNDIDWDYLEDLFETACLLHDVGHAPFSHSGEGYYRTSGKSDDPLYELLKATVSDESFTQDMEYYTLENTKPAAPHEMMSVIVSIESFKDYFKDSKSKSFFARCITGYLHQKPKDFEEDLENILIKLLNSSIINVDKLDYLIRDAYVTGYDNTHLDYHRLLNSIMMYKVGEEYELVFDKSALSVLENVIYAHDSEKKWIQSHPIILYEQFLVKYAIKHVNSCINKNEQDHHENLICFDAITEKGKKFQDITISYLCDDDVIFLVKNVCPDELTHEYFERDKWRHPLWKSESEFRSIINTIGSEAINEMNRYLKRIHSFLSEKEIPILNDATIKEFEKMISDLKDTNNPKLSIDKKKNLELDGKTLEFMKHIREILKSKNIPFDLVVLKSNDFKSGFQKEELSNTKIYFPSLNRVNNLRVVLNTLNFTEDSMEMYYIYYRPTYNNDILVKIDLNEFMNKLRMYLVPN